MDASGQSAESSKVNRKVIALSKRVSDPKLRTSIPIQPDHKLTSQQKILLLTFAYGNICAGTVYSSIAPFFPKEVIRFNSSYAIS